MCPKTWEWEKCVQNWCRRCWPWTERQTSEDMLGTPSLCSRCSRDESWIFEYDPETKRQSFVWHAPGSHQPKKTRIIKSKAKCMLIVLFECNGVVHKEFIPPDKAVNTTFYVTVLERLRKQVARVHLAIADSSKLHHDNAPRHRPRCHGLPCWTPCSNASSATLQHRCRSPRLLSLPPIQTGSERTAPRLGSGHSRGRNEGVKVHSGFCA